MNGDLVTFLVNISSIFDPLVTLVTVIAAIIGVIMVGNALVAAYALSADDGKWRGQGNATYPGIIWSLVIGGILVSPIVMVQAMGNTLLNGEAVNGSAMLYQSSGLSSTQQAALKAIFGLFVIAGYVAFIKGWMLIDKHTNGVTRDGAGAGVTFIVSGVLMVYLDVVMQVVSEKTGIDFVKVLFF